MTDTAQTMLEPCPFCGGEAGYFASQEALFRAHWVDHVYHCTNCQARVQNTDRQTAQSMWNTRSPAIGTPDDAREADRCVRCGYPLSEHGYNAACYGLCGTFVAPPSDSPGSAQGFDPTNHHNALKCPYCNPQGLVFAHQPQGGSFTERAIKLIREAAGHQDDWGKYEYAVIDLAREADSAHQPQDGDAREALQELYDFCKASNDFRQDSRLGRKVRTVLATPPVQPQGGDARDEFMVSQCDDQTWMVHTKGDILAYPGQGDEEKKARVICAALNAFYATPPAPVRAAAEPPCVIMPAEPPHEVISAAMQEIPEDGCEYEHIEAAYRAMRAALSPAGTNEASK